MLIIQCFFTTPLQDEHDYEHVVYELRVLSYKNGEFILEKL